MSWVRGASGCNDCYTVCIDHGAMTFECAACERKRMMMTRPTLTRVVTLTIETDAKGTPAQIARVMRDAADAVAKVNKLEEIHNCEIGRLDSGEGTHGIVSVEDWR